MSPYQIQVLAFVHAIRVEPEVEIHRLVLADYLEEYSKRVGVESRTLIYLRNGRMVCNSLDIQAMHECLAIFDEFENVQVITGRYRTLYDLILDVHGRVRVWASIEDYKTLWDMVIDNRHRRLGKEVMDEAEAIVIDREANKLPPIASKSA